MFELYLHIYPSDMAFLSETLMCLGVVDKNERARRGKGPELLNKIRE